MNKLRSCLLLASMLGLVGVTRVETQSEPPLLIRNVVVLPMTGPVQIGERQDVLVRNRAIAAIGRSLSAPAGARIVDGAGRFLLPGLADMHVHVFDAAELPHYVASGVTTIRNMWGWELHQQLAADVEAGKRIGPSIWTTGPLVDGPNSPLKGAAIVRSADEARAAVRAQDAAGFKGIKVYNRISLEAFDAVLAEADAVGLPVFGHVPTAVGLERVIASSIRSIEHLWGFPAFLTVGEPRTWSGTLDTDRLVTLARRMAADGVWNCPTLVVGDREDMEPGEAAAFLALPEAVAAPASLKKMWPSRVEAAADPAEPARRRANRLAVVKALRDAGTRIVAGTDTGNPFVIPGLDLHTELELLVQAGLTPGEALAAATTSPAILLGQATQTGRIEPGYRADLVLLDANPLADIRNTRRIAGVVLNGRWLDRAALDGLLKAR